MSAWLGSKKGGHKSGNSHNRINVLIAVIFLLVLGIIAKLWWLEVWRHQYYIAKASELHMLNVTLEPERGKIYLQDKSKEGGIYAIATNKENALIFAVPKDLKDIDRLIDKSYEFFKQADFAKEIDEQLQQEERVGLDQALRQGADSTDNILRAHQARLQDPYYLGLKADKKQALLAAKKAAYYSDMKTKLQNQDDLYEIIAKKVDLDEAKKFHLSLLSDVWENADIRASDLTIKNNKVYWLQDGQEKELSFTGVYYQSEYYRYYADKDIACHVLGYTDYEKSDKNGQIGRHGHYGLEGFFDDELFGKTGQVTAEKGAEGTLIVLNRQQEDKKNGDDLVLTIDRSIQFQVNSTLKRAVEAYSADHASAIVMDPKTGAIIALASYPGFDPNNYNQVKDGSVLNNPVIFDQYEPGSIFKAITMASALNEGKVKPEDTYQDTGQIMINGWSKPISNSDYSSAGAHGLTTMTQVLEKSLNTGSIHVMRQIGDQTFADYVRRFGFGEKTGIELEGEAKGTIANLNKKKIREIDAATASFGQGITVTPIQMVTAYAALANGGRLVKPHVVQEIRYPDGNVMITPNLDAKRVISPEASAYITGMLINVVENGHSKGTKIPGYYIAGKTGTAQIADKVKGGYGLQYNHSFVGYAPADDPRFVILVKISKPKGFEYAESTAVPTAHEIIAFILNYWQVPKTRN